MKRKLILLFAVLVGGMLAFIVNREQVSADKFQKPKKKVYCLPPKDNICFVEGNRTVPGIYVEEYF